MTTANREDQEEPFFITEEIEADMRAAGYVLDPPAHVTTTNIRELFGWQPGETLAEAINRHQVEQANVLADKDDC